MGAQAAIHCVLASEEKLAKEGTATCASSARSTANQLRFHTQLELLYATCGLDFNSGAGEAI